MKSKPQKQELKLKGNLRFMNQGMTGLIALTALVGLISFGLTRENFAQTGSENSLVEEKVKTVGPLKVHHSQAVTESKTAKSRGQAQVGYISLDNYLEQYVDFFVDDTYCGTAGPNGMVKCYLQAGAHEVYFKSRGLNSEPSKVDLIGGKDFIIELKETED